MRCRAAPAAVRVGAQDAEMSNAMPEFFGDPPEIIGGVLVREADRELELNVAPGHDVWPLHRITLRPRRGLPMIVRRRAWGGQSRLPQLAT